MTWNAARLTPSRQLVLEHLVQDHKPDVMAVTETELELPDIGAVNIPGYTVVSPDASEKVRVLLLVRNDLTFKKFAAVQDFPAVWILLQDYNLVIGGIYRQFASGQNSGLAFEKEQLSVLIEQITCIDPKHKLCLAGDLNLDLARSEDTSYSRQPLLREWLSTLDAQGIAWLPTGSTWKSHGTFAGKQRTSTLDHIYMTMDLADRATVEVLDCAATDHSPVRAIIPPRYPRGSARKKEPLPRLARRNFSSIDYPTLNADLEALGPWPTVPAGADPNALLDDLYSVLYPLLDKHAPVRSFPIRPDTAPLLLKPDTRKVMRKRDIARAKGNKGEYKALRNKAVGLIRRDRLTTANEKIKMSKNPSAEAWKLAGAIIRPSSTSLPLLIGTKCDEECANKVNQFYITKVQEIVKKFPPRAKTSTIPRPGLMFSLHCVGVNAVKKAIRSMNNTRALGVDGIPVDFWKSCMRSLALPITYLVNASIQSGVVPALFKQAIIHPIYKGGSKDPMSPASYRPIAVLPALSKVLERIIYNQLSAHLEEHHLLPQEQHGFRKSRSITTAMASAIHSWATRRRMGTGDPELGICAFDFSSAFDTVDVVELMNKLEMIGATEATRAWFHDYMSGGLQQVHWNHGISCFLRVKVGVRQGSIIGPLAFLLITVEVPETLGNAVAYADDVTGWTSGGDLPTLCTNLEHCSTRLVELSSRLRLLLNAGKTQVMWVGGSSALEDLPSLRINETQVKPAASIEILGLKLDRKLSPTPYTTSLQSSLARGLGMLRRLAANLPPHLLSTFAQGLFFSRLRTYAGLVFTVRLNENDRCTQGAKQIQVMINNVARVITNLRRVDHISVRDLLARANLPSLNSIVVEAAGMLAWSMTNEDHPLHNLYLASQIHSVTRAAAAGAVRVTDAQESIGVRNAQLVWNACPALRAATSKRTAKTVLGKFIKEIPVI